MEAALSDKNTLGKALNVFFILILDMQFIVYENDSLLREEPGRYNYIED